MITICCSCNCFPKFFKILDPPFDFILTEFVWIPELCFLSTTNFNFEVDLTSNVFSFISKVEWFKNWKCSWLWNLAFFDFFHCQKSVNDCIGASVIYVTDVSEWKRWITRRTVLILVDSVVFIVQTFNWFSFFSPSEPFMTIDQRASPYDLRHCGYFANYLPTVFLITNTVETFSVKGIRRWLT